MRSVTTRATPLARAVPLSSLRGRRGPGRGGPSCLRTVAPISIVIPLSTALSMNPMDEDRLLTPALSPAATARQRGESVEEEREKKLPRVFAACCPPFMVSELRAKN